MLAVLAASITAGSTPGSAPASSPFQVVFQAAVPDGQSSWTDIRWATDDSVFLVSAYHGVREVALDGKLTRRRQAVPGKATLKRFQEFGRLAVSPEYLVVAGYDHNLAWRTLPPASGAGVVFFQHRAIATSQDVDLRGDRLLLLGVPSLQSAQRALIWTGSIGAGLDDLKPLLPEDDEPLWRCSYLSLGAARFLPDGSFLVVPGVRPGAHLFDRNNRLIRTFSPAELGVDTDCSQLTPEEGNRIQEDPGAYGRWMKRHRVLEAILPLALKRCHALG